MELSSNKLKWYEWDGVGEIPSGVVGVTLRNLVSIEDISALKHPLDWSVSMSSDDIIAYTLGEELEVDDE